MGQVTVCPSTTSTELDPCVCPSNWYPCKVSGGLITEYGGCAPNGVTIETVTYYQSLGTCYYCPAGTSNVEVDIVAQTIKCNGILYGLVPAEGVFPDTLAPLPNGETYPPVTSPSRSPSSPSSSSSCFAASETLLLESGATVPMSEVHVGDKVLVASLDGKSTYYSPVMVVPHARNSDKATFVHLSTVSGKDVKMTADHLVMAGVCGGSSSLVPAGTVQVGSCLQTLSGDDIVSNVSVVAGEGLYTAVPMEDALLVVNGVMASPFAVNHVIANAMYNIHRIVPFFMRNDFINKALSIFGSLVAPVASA